MPVVSFDPEAGILARVCAACGAPHAHAVADLTLGVAQDPNVVALPACVCGARECLVRTWDRCPAEHAGSPFDAQRRAVNELGQRLKDAGRVHASQRAAVAAERGAPPDLPRRGSR